MSEKNRKIVYGIMLFLGISILIWENEIYRQTFIDWKIPLSILIVSGILAFTIDFKNFKKTYNYKIKEAYFYSIFYYFIGFGSIICSSFMLINYYLSDTKIENHSCVIVERSEISGGKGARKSQPTFIINYKGKNKELVFNSRYVWKQQFYNEVEITTQKGYFGFDVIIEQKLK
jgi:hypothetical protein